MFIINWKLSYSKLKKPFSAAELLRLHLGAKPYQHTYTHILRLLEPDQ